MIFSAHESDKMKADDAWFIYRRNTPVRWPCDRLASPQGGEGQWKYPQLLHCRKRDKPEWLMCNFKRFLQHIKTSLEQIKKTLRRCLLCFHEEYQTQHNMPQVWEMGDVFSHLIRHKSILRKSKKGVVCSVAMKYVEVQQVIRIINNWCMVSVRPSSNVST